MKSSIGLIKNKYIYKGDEYGFKEIDKLILKLKRKRELVIFEENIFIKKYDIDDKKINIPKFVSSKIIQEFIGKDNLSFHYEYKKSKNILYLYAINSYDINRFYKRLESISIKPVQFLIKDIVLRSEKNKDKVIVLYKFLDLFYLLIIKDKILVSSQIFDDEKKLIDKLKDCNEKITLDCKLTYLNIENKNIINIGDRVDEIFN